MSSSKSSTSSFVAIAAVALVGFGALGAILLTSGNTKKAVSDEAAIKIAQAASTVQNTPKGSEEFSASQQEQIGKIARDYLMKNPEILLELQRELESRMELAQAARTKQAVEANRADLFGGKTSISVGKDDAPITVVEFFDYNCGFCKRAVEQMNELRKVEKNVRIVMKEMPIFGAQSEAAARVAIAARKQGKYWEVHRGLLTAKGQASGQSAMRIAEELGLDMDQLKKDAGSRETVEIIRETQNLGRKLGIQGTPHFFVNDKMIAGAPQDLLEQIRALIAEERKKS